MRELTCLTDELEAQKLSAYLQVQGIDASTENDDDGWIVWVLNDDDRDKAKQLLQEYLDNPSDPKFENAERKVRSAIKEANRLRRANDRTEKLQKRWEGSWWHCYPATYIMIGICVVVSVIGTDWTKMQTSQFGLPALCNDRDSKLLDLLFIETPALVIPEPDDEGEVVYYDRNPDWPAKLTDVSAVWESLTGKAAATWRATKRTVLDGHVWRLIGPIFVHLGVAHILFNMMWLRSLGGTIEYARGTRRFLLLCLIIAVTSNIGQLFWAGPYFGGMSGVVFGLIGYVWMKGRTQPKLGLGLEHRVVVYSFLWLFLCMSGAIGRIANAAHLVGFIVGILIGARQAIWKKLRFGR